MAARPLSGPTRDEVIAAALSVLDAEGQQGLTVRRVAEALTTSTQIVYSRFGGMEGLLAATGVEVFRQLADLCSATPQDPDPVAEAVDLALRFRRYSLDHPHRMAMLTAPLTSADAHAAAKAEAGLSMERMTAPIARACPGAAPATIHQLGAVLWASLHGLVEMERSGPLDPGGAEERIRLLISRLLR